MTIKTLPVTPDQFFQSAAAPFLTAIKQSADGVRVAIPAFLAADMDTSGEQTVTVQVAIQERVGTPTGAQWWDIPPITHVPVVVPRGGGFAITLPLKKGDEGLLVFCDMCFDNWWSKGATGPSAANVSSATGSQRQLEVRRHHVHDCGFIPGMWSQPNVLSGYSASALQIRSEDGATVISVADGAITVSATTINVTGETVNVTGSSSVVVSGNSATKIDDRVFMQHTHSGVTTGGGVSGTVV